MTIEKENIGQTFYFVAPLGEDLPALVETGKLTSILPRYNYKDAYSGQKREMTYLFSVDRVNGRTDVMCPSAELIFQSLHDVIEEYKSAIDLVFGFSIVRSKDD